MVTIIVIKTVIVNEDICKKGNFKLYYKDTYKYFYLSFTDIVEKWFSSVFIEPDENIYAILMLNSQWVNFLLSHGSMNSNHPPYTYPSSASVSQDAGKYLVCT